MVLIKTMQRATGLLFLLLIAGALGSCSVTPSLLAPTAGHPLPAAWAPEGIQRTITVSWTLPESIVVSEQSVSACSARSLSTAGVVQWERPLPFCPDRASVVAGGLVLFQTSAQS